MKITNLEIKHLVDEMQFLKGGTIESINHNDKELTIRVLQEKRYNLYVSPDMVCLTDKENVRDVTDFSMILRKYLKSKKIENIIQHNFDRIVEIWTDSNILILEMDNPNYVLCDRNYNIIMPMQFQRLDDRNIVANEAYAYPKSLDIRDINVVEKWLKTDETILNLLTEFFGRYAKDALIMAKVDRDKAAKNLDHGEVMRVKGNINLFVFGKKQPQITFKENKMDVLLFDLETRGFDRKKYFDSYTEALGYFMSKSEDLVRKVKADKKRIKKLKKKKRKKIIIKKRKKKR